LADDDERRHLPLTGVLNARDLGGYATQDGRVVRWGRVYRSGMLGSATTDDMTELRSRGLRSVCDLRSGPERRAAPEAWLDSAGIETWGYPDDEWTGDSRQLLERCLVSGERTREVMREAYAVMPFIQVTAYGEIFRRLALGDGPLLFHCSAGKDRSGGVAALLLKVLGVADADIVADYRMTLRVHDELCRAFVAIPRHAEANPDHAAAWLPMMDADPEYLRSMFDAIVERRGSVEAYLASDLGIGPGMLEGLRSRLLE
jgi:protein-tyrosine phosphatase